MYSTKVVIVDLRHGLRASCLCMRTGQLDLGSSVFFWSQPMGEREGNESVGFKGKQREVCLFPPLQRCFVLCSCSSSTSIHTLLLSRNTHPTCTPTHKHTHTHCCHARGCHQASKGPPLRISPLQVHCSLDGGMQPTKARSEHGTELVSDYIFSYRNQEQHGQQAPGFTHRECFDSGSWRTIDSRSIVEPLGVRLHELTEVRKRKQIHTSDLPSFLPLVPFSSFCSLLNVVQVFSLLLVPFSKRQFFEVNARVAGSMWKVMQVRRLLSS